MESIHGITEFSVVFLNGRGKHIKLSEGEQKIPQINFAIDAINGKTEDAVSELMSGSSSEPVRSKSKTYSKKSMEDIRKFQKGHEENRKQIKLLAAEKQKLNQKLQILLEENKAPRTLLRCLWIMKLQEMSRGER